MKTSASFLLKAATAAFGLGLSLAAAAVPVNVLWYDATPEYGGQSSNAFRAEFAGALNAYNGGASFNATYVNGQGAGKTSLATALAANSYSVVFIDDTGGDAYSAADKTALQGFYQNHRNLLLDGSIYVRNITGFPNMRFPGPNGALSGLTVNEANSLASRGGGIFFGTDHNCCQTSINDLLGSILPGAAFSGVAAPNVSGSFYGNDLLNNGVAIAANDVLVSWSSEGSQGIPPKGNFTDFTGGAVALAVLADFPNNNGTRSQFVTASWAVGSGTTVANDTTTGGTAGNGNNGGTGVPVPASAFLVLLGAVALFRRQAQA
jgi:hypothetical protein